MFIDMSRSVSASCGYCPAVLIETAIEMSRMLGVIQLAVGLYLWILCELLQRSVAQDTCGLSPLFGRFFVLVLLHLVLLALSKHIANLSLLRIWGSHSGGYEEFYLLEYSTV
jgi:hypothetical protein